MTFRRECIPNFQNLFQAKCEELGRELIPKELFEMFEKNYLEHKQKYVLSSRKIYEESENGNDYVHFQGQMMKINGNEEVSLSGVGNGPIDAFFNAIKKVGLDKYEFISYSQHAISQGSDSKAVSYIELKKPDGKSIFGIGMTRMSMLHRYSVFSTQSTEPRLNQFNNSIFRAVHMCSPVFYETRC